MLVRYGYKFFYFFKSRRFFSSLSAEKTAYHEEHEDHEEIKIIDEKTGQKWAKKSFVFMKKRWYNHEAWRKQHQGLK